MSILTDENLEKAHRGDLEVLAELDAQGFLIGADETAESYSQRLKAFCGHVATMETSLSQTGTYTIEGIKVGKDDRISDRRFEAIADRTRQLYNFSIDWVPGFYVDPTCSFLFGGCAFCQYPDFFTLFIIRRSFKNQAKWLIYDRDELLAHELCHVARIGLLSERYEETFAYRTSASGFRRLVGGMFCRQADSFMFLGAALLLFVGRVVQTFAWQALPMWPFAALLAAVFGWLCIRHTLSMRCLERARRVLEGIYGDNAWAVLFRCTDEEIRDFAGGRDVPRSSLRWQVIERRFGKGGQS